MRERGFGAAVEKEPLRLAVLGAGGIGRLHVERIARSGEARLVAICDPAPAARALAEAHHARHHHTLESMLLTEALDGVIIATPTCLHARQAAACIAEKLPVLVEKPIADNFDEARKLVATAKKAGVSILVGHHRRHNPLAAEARRLIRAGELGEVLLVSGLWATLKPFGYFETPWRRQPGGGPVLINLIHEIDMLRYLFGEVDRIGAETANRARGLPVEDAAVLTLRFATGVLGSIALTDAAPSPWTWEQATGENPGFPKSGRSHLRILGSKAALEFPGLALWRQEEGTGWEHPLSCIRAEIAESDALALQLAHFLEVIRGEATPLSDGADGTRTLQTTLAVHEAAATGAAVELDFREPEELAAADPEAGGTERSAAAGGR
jgi:predicted dehydrogenase